MEAYPCSFIDGERVGATEFKLKFGTKQQIALYTSGEKTVSTGSF